MFDPSAIVVNVRAGTAQAASALGGMVGTFAKMGGAAKLAAAAIALISFQNIRATLQEAERLEDAVSRLAMVTSRDVAEPLSRGIRNLARNMPIARDELMETAIAASRLGVQGSANIIEFTRQMAMIETVTDMTARGAAENFARIGAVLDVPIDKIGELAAVANFLADNMATSFSEVVQSTGQLAATLKQLNFAPEEILAIAAASNAVNVSVRRGATQLRSFFQQLTDAGRLDDLAVGLRMTRDELDGMIDSNPMEIFMSIIAVMEQGGRAARDMGSIFDSAARQGLGSLGLAADELRRAMALANEEMNNPNSIHTQFAEILSNQSSKAQILENRVKELRTELGQKLLPAKKAVYDLLLAIIPEMDNLGRKFGDLAHSVPTVELNNFAAALEWVEGVQRRIVSMDMMGNVLEEVDPAVLQRVSGYVMNLAGSFEDVNDGAAFASAAIQETTATLARMKASGREIDMDDVFSFLDDLAVKFLVQGKAFREEWEKINDVDDPKIVEKIERLKGMNLAAVEDALQSMGLSLSQVTDAEARLLLQIIETNIALNDGEDAARRFALTLQSDVTPAIAELIVEGERSTRIKEVWKAQEESLKNYARELVFTEEEVERLRLAEEGLNDEQIKRIQTTQRHLDDLKDIMTAQESYREELERLRMQLAGLGDNERVLYQAQLRRMNLTSRQIDELLDLHDTIERVTEAEKQRTEELREAERVQERLQRRAEQFDLSSAEVQLRFVESAVRDVTDGVMSMFDVFHDENKNFEDAMLDTIAKIGRAMLELYIQSKIFGFAESFGLFGGTSGAASQSMGMGNLPGIGRLRNVPTPSRVGPVHSGASQQVSVQNSFEISALDARGVEEILVQNAPLIANETAKQFGKSTSLKRRAFG